MFDFDSASSISKIKLSKLLILSFWNVKLMFDKMKSLILAQDERWRYA